MERSRWTLAVLGILGSLGVSGALWLLFGSPVFFLFVPFVPFVLGRGGTSQERMPMACPNCSFETRDPSYRYCPRDGARLEER